MENNPAYNEPLVSVIMCAYNGLPYIQEAVNSVVQQSYQHWELIISDDGSTDGTREWLTAYALKESRIRLFIQENNLGYVRNKNFAHQQARGIYLTQLDNDDTCAADRLSLQVAAINMHPDIRIVSCGYHKIDASGNVYHTVTGISGLLKTAIDEEYPFWFPSLLVHRSVFEAVGWFNEYFSGALGDDVYWTRRANRDYKIWHIDQPLYSYRSNPHSITNNYGNVRKLILPKVIDFLIQQQSAGTDWLETGDYDKLEKMEAGILADRKYISERYRMGAATAVMQRRQQQAYSLLWISFIKYPFNIDIYKTFIYAIKSRLSKDAV